jgi:hypothetical protein
MRYTLRVDVATGEVTTPVSPVRSKVPSGRPKDAPPFRADQPGNRYASSNGAQFRRTLPISHGVALTAAISKEAFSESEERTVAQHETHGSAVGIELDDLSHLLRAVDDCEFERLKFDAKCVLSPRHA